MSNDLSKHAHVTPFAALTARARDLALLVKSAARAWANRREAMTVLARMDQRMLQDIGLTSADIHSALAEPVWSDPTVRLRLLAVERRAAARATAHEQAEVHGQAMREASEKQAGYDLKIAC